MSTQHDMSVPLVDRSLNVTTRREDSVIKMRPQKMTFVDTRKECALVRFFSFDQDNPFSFGSVNKIAGISLSIQSLKRICSVGRENRQSLQIKTILDDLLN